MAEKLQNSRGKTKLKLHKIIANIAILRIMLDKVTFICSKKIRLVKMLKV